MKLTLYEFKRLPEQEQYSIAFNCGTFIDYLEQKNKKLVLYAINLFYVQVVYNTTTNKIINITPFKTGKRLFRYSNFKGDPLNFIIS